MGPALTDWFAWTLIIPFASTIREVSGVGLPTVLEKVTVCEVAFKLKAPLSVFATVMEPIAPVLQMTLATKIAGLLMAMVAGETLAVILPPKLIVPLAPVVMLTLVRGVFPPMVANWLITPVLEPPVKVRECAPSSEPLSEIVPPVAEVSSVMPVVIVVVPLTDRLFTVEMLAPRVMLPVVVAESEVG